MQSFGTEAALGPAVHAPVGPDYSSDQPPQRPADQKQRRWILNAFDMSTAGHQSPGLWKVDGDRSAGEGGYHDIEYVTTIERDSRAKLMHESNILYFRLDTGRMLPRSWKRGNSTGCCESKSVTHWHRYRLCTDPLVTVVTISVADTLGAYDVYGGSIDGGEPAIAYHSRSHGLIKGHAF